MLPRRVEFTTGRWCRHARQRTRLPTSAAQDRLHLHSASGLTTQTLARMLDSLVRVSRRAGYDHFLRILTTHRHPRRTAQLHAQTQQKLSPTLGTATTPPPENRDAHCLSPTRDVPRKPTSGPQASIPRVEPILSPGRRARSTRPAQHQPRTEHATAPLAARNRFPLSNFRYSLTLFSKFFSSFLHSTCSLSVSCHYLALDGIYHPLWPAFPSKPTRRRPVVRTRVSRPHGAITLYDALFQGTVRRGRG